MVATWKVVQSKEHKGQGGERVWRQWGGIMSTAPDLGGLVSGIVNVRAEHRR